MSRHPSIPGGGDLTAAYVIQTADASLPSAQVLASLATGVVLNATSTGVLSIATLNGLTLTAGTLANDLIAGKAGGQTLVFGTATGNGGVVSSNPSQDGAVNFGTMTTPSRWVDTTNASGADIWNIVSGKNGGGKRTALALHNRGSSLGDDIRIAVNSASGSTYPGSSSGANSAVDFELLTASEYQISLLPGNSSGTPTKTFTASGLNKVSTFFGGVKFPWNAQAADYTVLLSDFAISEDTTAADRIVTLPSAVTAGAGATFIVKRITAGANALTVKATAGTIDGAAAGTGISMATQYMSRIFESDGANWNIVGGWL